MKNVGDTQLNNSTIACALLSAAALLSNGANAETLNFRGTALPTCALAAPTDGVIVLGADLQSWATTVPATIAAVNTAPATITVTRPSTWYSSPASTPATTFTHSVSLTGTNLGTLTGTGTASSGPLTALGSTVVAVSLGATAGSPYRAGDYIAQVTVTCTVP